MIDTSDVARPLQSQKVEPAETDSTIKRKYSNKKNKKVTLESLPPGLLGMIFNELSQVDRHKIELLSHHLRGVVRRVTWHLDIRHQTCEQIERLYLTLASDEHRSSMISSIRIDPIDATGFPKHNRPGRLPDSAYAFPVGGRENYMRNRRGPRRIETSSHTSKKIDPIDKWNQVFLESTTRTGSTEALLAEIIISATKLRKLELIAGHDFGDHTILEILNNFAETMHSCDRVAFPALKIVHVCQLYPQNEDKEVIVYRNITELRIALPTLFNESFERIVLRPSPGDAKTTLIKKLQLTGYITAYRIVRDYVALGQARFLEELEVVHRVHTSDDVPVSDLVDALAHNCKSLKKLSIGTEYVHRVEVPNEPLSLKKSSRLDFPQLTYLALECDHVINRSSHSSGQRRHMEEIFALFFTMLPHSVKHARIGGWNTEDVKTLVDDNQAKNPFLLCQDHCPGLRSLRLTVDLTYSRNKEMRTDLELHIAKMHDFALLAGMQLEVGWYIKSVMDQFSKEIHFAGALLDPITAFDWVKEDLEK